MLSLIGGGIAIWWWGKEILEFISPILNIGEIIRNMDRGNNPGNDPGNNAFGNNAPRNNAPENNAPQNDGLDFDEIELNDHEAMMVYAADMVDRTPTNPQAPLPPIPPTNQGPPAPPAPVFDQEAFDKMKEEKHPVKSSYSEKMSKYQEKIEKYKEKMAAKAAESGGTIADEIKLGKKLKKVDLNEEITETSKANFSNPSSSKNQTLSEKLSSKFDKMRGNDDSDSETVKDNEEWDKKLKNKGKNKFLESIKSENKIEHTTDFKNYPPALKPIIEKFPNLSKETLDKLSTPEGIKNRKAIIASLPPNELNLTPSIESVDFDTNKFDKLIKDNLNLDSEALVKKIEKEIPGYNIDNYRSDFMKAIKADINSGKTIEERNQIFKEYQKTDLDEIQNLGDNYKIRDIKNIVRENYTHNSLLNELKTKSSIKNLEEFKNLPPDQAFELAKDLEGNKIDSNLLDKADKFLHSVLLENIDNAMYKLITTHPKKNKQELVEQLINENPNNKEIILKRVKDTVDSGLDYMVKNLDESEFNEKIDSLMKNDLKERESVNENININKIKILKSVNKSHSNLLDAIKNNSSENLKHVESEKRISKSSYENTMSNKQFDDTEELFD
uniref:Uncharacterized protein n=1 Tax=Russula abietina TaxID=482377 RepID=A0A2S0U3N4_9AGAM|nr:hypothetical protein [Russula abietina]AWB36101.1 hypothetical protein [Russula abietina]